MLDTRPALVVAVIVGLLLATFLHADGQVVTLKGHLYGAEDSRDTGAFVLDADELGAIAINVGQVSYIGDFLDGFKGSRVIVTIGPEAK